ncbi:MAG TPA: NAD(P)H-hydrate dehydratase [Flavobacterium sp.]|nr:NAD(P)H-hydrate dehydratase [Flavobacterium sp.]
MIHQVHLDDIRSRYKPVADDAHKGTQGHALIIGGSYGMIGAVCLSAKAALKSGCGLVTAFLPKCGYQIIQSFLPEAMALTDNHDNFITETNYSFKPQAIGIGPGIGTDIQTQLAFHHFLQQLDSPLVIDADAINILALNKDWLSLLPRHTILTPHPKELERLIGTWNSDDQKQRLILDFCIKYKVIIVNKGAPTLIFADRQIFKNTTGNSALATAGSGDVLTGIITGLLAQQYNPTDAAIVGVYVHGLTADLAVQYMARQAFTASDIINQLGKAFLVLDHDEGQQKQ